MASNLTGAELLVRLIEEAGVEICFANPGTTEMQIVGALSNSRVRVVLGLHENVVTGAADGYARMSQAPSMTFRIAHPEYLRRTHQIAAGIHEAQS